MIRQPAGVTCLAFSRDGSLIITGHMNRILRVHDLGSGKLVATLRGHRAPVNLAVVSPNGNHVATGGRDGALRVFDLNRREEERAFGGHRKAVAGLAYFPEGSELASVAMEHSLILWDAATGAQRTTLWGAKGEVFAGVAVTGEEPLVVAGLADGSLRVWAPD